MILTCREQRLGILLSTLHGPGQTHRDNDLASKGNSAAAAGNSYTGEYRCSITLTCVYICLCGSDGKESACNAGDPDLTPGWEDPLEGDTPVFLPGESHGQRSLAGCSPWGHKSRTQLSD